MGNCPKKRPLLVLVLACLLFPCLVCRADTAQATATTPPLTPGPIATNQETPPNLSDRAELEAYLDSFFADQMSRYHITGATFSLVKDGQLYFSKGYGYTTTAHTRPISPVNTVFRVGSVSKLFVATAIMQLAEQGKLRLDDDVNRYLTGFKLPLNFGRPVTIANLLTHTAGFEERETGIATLNPQNLLPLGDYLRQRLPALVAPPGQQDSYAYSNHGYALAGYLVQVVSGKPFDQYVRDNILQPLDMRYSSFDLTPELNDLRATGYKYAWNDLQPLPFDYQQVAPAGALNASADDIAHFMLAQLQTGSYNGKQILQPASVREMQARQYTHNPALNGITYGFDEYFQNGLRTLYHEGNWPGFTSLLMLIPDKQTGFFISYNRDINIPREKLAQEFIDRYFPAATAAEPPKSIASTASDVAKFAGTYRSSRYNRTNLEKLFSLTVQGRVVAEPDGRLTLPTDSLLYRSSHWVEVEPQLFRLTDGNDFSSEYLYFEQDGQGNVTHMFVGLNDWEKLDWYEQSFFQVLLAGVMALIFTLGPLSWAATHLRIGSQSRDYDYQPLISHLLWRVSLVYSTLVLAFLSGLSITIVVFRDEFIYGPPAVLLPLLILPFFTTALTPVLVAGTALAWKNRYWSGWGRAYYTLLTLTALLYVAFLLYWNLLGFNF